MFEKWWKASQIYFDRRMMTMIGLGFSSGFPLLLIFGTLNLWLKDAGLSLAMIGAFSLVKTPYSFKWMWSPIIDMVNLPLFCRLGRRRGWAVFTQILLMFAIFGMAVTNPAQDAKMMAFFAVLVAFFSASQDVVLDAYRIESFDEKEQGAGVAIFVLGYRFGLIFSGALALWLASFLSWEAVYMLMALGALVGMMTILCSKEPRTDVACDAPKQREKIKIRIKNFFVKAIVNPFGDFLKRPNWFLILLFIMLYRLCDSYMGPMAMPFYDDMGFTKTEIAYVTKVYGLFTTIFGGVVGGLIVSRFGLIKSLIIGSFMQGLTTLMFVAQAYAGHNVYMLIATISLDNLAGGMAATAFVAYLSSLCNVAYTATQYALLSSFMSLARDIFAATSGVLASVVSWPMFFTISTLMAIPGLVMIVYMNKKYPTAKPCEEGDCK